MKERTDEDLKSFTGISTNLIAAIRQAGVTGSANYVILIIINNNY